MLWGRRGADAPEMEREKLDLGRWIAVFLPPPAQASWASAGQLQFELSVQLLGKYLGVKFVQGVGMEATDYATASVAVNTLHPAGPAYCLRVS